MPKSPEQGGMNSAESKEITWREFSLLINKALGDLADKTGKRLNEKQVEETIQHVARENNLTQAVSPMTVSISESGLWSALVGYPPMDIGGSLFYGPYDTRKEDEGDHSNEDDNYHRED